MLTTYFERKLTSRTVEPTCQWICPVCRLLLQEMSKVLGEDQPGFGAGETKNSPITDRFASSKYGLKFGLLGVNLPRFVESPELRWKSAHRGV